MHCSWDPQVQNSVNFKLKLGLTALFTHLKIILLQYFQFSVISGIQTNPKMNSDRLGWKKSMLVKVKFSGIVNNLILVQRFCPMV